MASGYTAALICYIFFTEIAYLIERETLYAVLLSGLGVADLLSEPLKSYDGLCVHNLSCHGLV